VQTVNPVAELGDDDIAAAAGSRMWRHLRANPAFWIGAVGVALIVGLALFAPLIARYDPLFQFRGDGLTPNGDPLGPTARFPLGTDKLGRDELSRLLFGARTSLLVGIGGTVAAAIIGVAIGSVAAFAGDVRRRLRLPGGHGIVVAIPIESLLMRFTDAVLSFPILLLAIALVAVVGSSLGLVVAIVAGFLWTAIARIVYARVRVVRELDFVTAARALGASPGRVLRRHVLPHLASIVVVYSTLSVAAAILFEATLSFLGVGVPPPSPSWGSMIFDHITYYGSDPRVVALPGLAIMATILMFNVLGDALADALDPHQWR
jgi:peptide/nickel transport system permease protein